MDLLLAPQSHRHLPERGDQLHLELMLLKRVGPQQPEEHTLGRASKPGQCALRALLQRRHVLEVRKHGLERPDPRAVLSRSGRRSDRGIVRPRTKGGLWAPCSDRQ